MCGVIGILGQSRVNQAIYEGLTVLQHRGQDAAGILTSDNQRVYSRRDNGLVRDVFQARHMEQLVGNMGIGHVRYPTAGCDSRDEAQPFFVNSPFGLALGHNGNLVNDAELREEVFRDDLRQLNTTSDSEILLNVFAHELRLALRVGTLRPEPEDVFKAMEGVYRRCRGAYAVVVLIVGFGILAFRDPNGVRPLVYGSRRSAGRAEHMVASESVALDVLGYQRIGDIQPGEAIFIDLEGRVHRRQCAASARLCPCIFEFVYLARPDSIIDGISVYKTRLRMGEKLAHQLLREWPDHDIDVVIPIPDTSRTAALQMSYEMNVKYREGFIKNRYIGRTFIMPGQAQRRRSVRQKLNAIELEFRGKNVLLVDDSIVRGTTSLEIIQMAREAGANRVYFASAAPPVRYQNVYGIDMPSAAELVANGRSVAEISKEIGADRLFYQDLEDLIDASHEGNPVVTEFDTSCFDGAYVTGDVSQSYLNDLEHIRSDSAKKKSSSGTSEFTETLRVGSV
ncbi:MAG: amidophosphoribosyltransferase [Gammaproteobacteria bacterium]|nr:amidophosphoribosyltransferase [Gammaproteobacteria bacterium]